MSTPTPNGGREVVVYLIADFIGAYSPAAEVHEAARYHTSGPDDIHGAITQAIWTYGATPAEWVHLYAQDGEGEGRRAWTDAGHRPLRQGDLIVVDGRAYSVTTAGYQPAVFDAERQVVKV